MIKPTPQQQEALQIELMRYLNTEIEKKSDWHSEASNFYYDECENEKAINGDEWLNGTNIKDASYIWKVGTAVAIDSNKKDFVFIALGIQRSHIHKPEIIGCFYFPQGENDDIAAVLHRFQDNLSGISHLFEPKSFDTIE